MRVVSLDQRSEEWLVWRRAGIGGSDAPAVMNASPWTSRDQLLRQKAGLGGETRQTSAMTRGRDLEPVARSLYESLMGLQVTDLCALHDQHDFIRASFDGHSNKHGGVALEIKAPNRDDHFLALEHHCVPEKYIWQCHHLLLVSGARLLHYISYSPQQTRLPDRLALVTVYRDEKPLEELLEAERLFWDEVLQLRASSVLEEYPQLKPWAREVGRWEETIRSAQNRDKDAALEAYADWLSEHDCQARARQLLAKW